VRGWLYEAKTGNSGNKKPLGLHLPRGYGGDSEEQISSKSIVFACKNHAISVGCDANRFR